MKKGRLFFISACFLKLLSSCAPQLELDENVHSSENFYCGKDDARSYQNEGAEKTYYRESRIELYSVVKDGDTLDINELICVDSVKFTQVLNQYTVHDMCVEMRIEGKTFFSAKTNKYGGFEEVSVIRGVDSCFRDLEEKIKKKVLSMRVIPENAGTYEVVFYHVFRLR